MSLAMAIWAEKHFNTRHNNFNFGALVLNVNHMKHLNFIFSNNFNARTSKYSLSLLAFLCRPFRFDSVFI